MEELSFVGIAGFGLGSTLVPVQYISSNLSFDGILPGTTLETQVVIRTDMPIVFAMPDPELLVRTYLSQDQLFSMSSVQDLVVVTYLSGLLPLEMSSSLDATSLTSLSSYLSTSLDSVSDFELKIVPLESGLEASFTSSCTVSVKEELSSSMTPTFTAVMDFEEINTLRGEFGLTLSDFDVVEPVMNALGSTLFSSISMRMNVSYNLDLPEIRIPFSENIGTYGPNKRNSLAHGSFKKGDYYYYPRDILTVNIASPLELEGDVAYPSGVTPFEVIPDLDYTGPERQ